MDMGIQHHLQALPQIGDAERHSAVTEAKVGDLDLDGNPSQLDHLMAPVELKGFTRREALGNEGRNGKPACLLSPFPHIAAHAVIAACKAFPLRLRSEEHTSELQSHSFISY